MHRPLIWWFLSRFAILVATIRTSNSHSQRRQSCLCVGDGEGGGEESLLEIPSLALFQPLNAPCIYPSARLRLPGFPDRAVSIGWQRPFAITPTSSTFQRLQLYFLRYRTTATEHLEEELRDKVRTPCCDSSFLFPWALWMNEPRIRICPPQLCYGQRLCACHSQRNRSRKGPLFRSFLAVPVQSEQKH